MNRIEISIYLTAKIKDDDATNIMVCRHALLSFVFASLMCSWDDQVQDVGAETDAISGLRAPTHFGRPNWDRVFPSIAEKHPDTDVGVVSVCVPTLRFPRSPLPGRSPFTSYVSASRLPASSLFCFAPEPELTCLPSVPQFFCGPPVLSKTLHQMSNKYSHPKGTKFFFGKGVFLHRLFCVCCSCSVFL